MKKILDRPIQEIIEGPKHFYLIHENDEVYPFECCMSCLNGSCDADIIKIVLLVHKRNS